MTAPDRPAEPDFTRAIPVLPAADAGRSLAWWTEICGFTEMFRDGTPPRYVGIKRGNALLHLSEMNDAELARRVGDQTMVRLVVGGVEAFHAEFIARGGVLHPNGGLKTQPWGTKEFGAIDPNGVCVAFLE
jgi:Glyoxalase superfamily protein